LWLHFIITNIVQVQQIIRNNLGRASGSGAAPDGFDHELDFRGTEESSCTMVLCSYLFDSLAENHTQL